MEMKTENNIITSHVLLDSSSLPKIYDISPGLYKVDLTDSANTLVYLVDGSIASEKNKENISNLVSDLYFAACGFKDCEMSLKKFSSLISCFSYNDIKIKDMA